MQYLIWCFIILNFIFGILVWYKTIKIKITSISLYDYIMIIPCLMCGIGAYIFVYSFEDTLKENKK